MSVPYQHLSIEEREKLRVMRERGFSVRAAARTLKRSPSSISRELSRNVQGKEYQAHAAQEAYCKRRERCVRRRRLDNPKLAALVIEKLKDFWSPEQIAGWLKRKRGKTIVSFVTIYRAIDCGILPVAISSCLRRHGWGDSPTSTEKRGRLQNYKSIHDRPKSANNRSRFGHWEGDTMRGALNKGCLATFVDRKSKFLLAYVMPDRKAATLCNAVHALFHPIPPNLRRSITVDHGNEFFSFSQIEADINTRLYFADPYHPGQRGLNENTNALLRQYFPKKFDFHSISQQDLVRVVAAINNRPRKTLQFRSPAELFPSSALLHFT